MFTVQIVGLYTYCFTVGYKYLGLYIELSHMLKHENKHFGQVLNVFIL